MKNILIRDSQMRFLRNLQTNLPFTKILCRKVVPSEVTRKTTCFYFADPSSIIPISLAFQTITSHFRILTTWMTADLLNTALRDILFLNEYRECHVQNIVIISRRTTVSIHTASIALWRTVSILTASITVWQKTVSIHTVFITWRTAVRIQTAFITLWLTTVSIHTFF